MCVCVYTYTHTHTHKYAYTHTHVQTYTHAHTHAHTHARMYNAVGARGVDQDLLAAARKFARSAREGGFRVTVILSLSLSRPRSFFL